VPPSYSRTKGLISATAILTFGGLRPSRSRNSRCSFSYAQWRALPPAARMRSCLGLRCRPALPARLCFATCWFSPTQRKQAQSGIPRAQPGSSNMTLSRSAGSTWKRLFTAGVRAPYSRALPTRSRLVSTVTSCGYSVRACSILFLPRPRAADAPLLPYTAGIYEEALVITKAITVPALSLFSILCAPLRLFCLCRFAPRVRLARRKQTLGVQLLMPSGQIPLRRYSPQ
jgi:hypothetical protein